MTDKTLADYTEEELEAMDPAERAALEEADEEEGDGEPGSTRRRSLYGRVQGLTRAQRELREENERLRREADDLRTRQIIREETRVEEEEDDPEPVAPTPPAAFDYAAARREKAKAATDGEFAKVAEIEDRIEAARDAEREYERKRGDYRDLLAERRVARAEAKAEAAGAAATQNANRTAVEVAVGKVIDKYPFLDLANKDANKLAINAVKGRRDELIAEGKSVAEAIRIAGMEVGAEFEKMGKGAAGKTTKGPEGRREQEVRRGANEASKVPGATHKGGGKSLPRDNEGKLDPKRMTDAQIMALSSEDVAKEFGGGAVDD